MAYTTKPADNETIANLPGDIRAVTALVTEHKEATSAAHVASAISYGAGTVAAELDSAAGHKANQNNPHNVTAAQVGAVALADAVTTITANKVVRRDSNGKIAGDITGTATNVAWSGITGAPPTFTPPVATTTTLGGVKQGSNVTIAVDGTLSVASPTVTASKQRANTRTYPMLKAPVWYSSAISTATNSNLPSYPFTVDVDDGGTLSTSTNTSSSSTYYVNYREIYTVAEDGIPAGTYTIQGLLQALVDRSHRHTTHSVQGYNTDTNCNCNCDCCGGGN